MQNEHLKKLLNELPRQDAGERFTDSVLARIEARGGRESRTSPRSWLAAAAAAIVLAAGAGHFIIEQREEARIEAITAQHRALEAEIAALREQASFDPVIDIGQDDGVQYILDLRPVDVQPVQTVALQPDFY